MKKLFENVAKAVEGNGKAYEKDNEVLTSLGENQEEREAIALICDEIDQTHSAFNEVVEAAKSGQSPEDWLKEELEKLDN